MSNLRTNLEKAERDYGEPIESMVVGKHHAAGWDAKPAADENVVLTRDAGLSKVDQDYDSGYGGADCFPLYAWTKSRVFFVDEYDGATSLAWVPRHPVDTEPEFSGN